jgi:hypothetical protein
MPPSVRSETSTVTPPAEMARPPHAVRTTTAADARDCAVRRQDGLTTCRSTRILTSAFHRQYARWQIGRGRRCRHTRAAGTGRLGVVKDTVNASLAQTAQVAYRSELTREQLQEVGTLLVDLGDPDVMAKAWE